MVADATVLSTISSSIYSWYRSENTGRIWLGCLFIAWMPEILPVCRIKATVSDLWASEDNCTSGMRTEQLPCVYTPTVQTVQVYSVLQGCTLTTWSCIFLLCVHTYCTNCTNVYSVVCYHFHLKISCLSFTYEWEIIVSHCKKEQAKAIIIISRDKDLMNRQRWGFAQYTSEFGSFFQRYLPVCLWHWGGQKNLSYFSKVLFHLLKEEVLWFMCKIFVKTQGYLIVI